MALSPPHLSNQNGLHQGRRHQMLPLVTKSSTGQEEFEMTNFCRCFRLNPSHAERWSHTWLLSGVGLLCISSNQQPLLPRSFILPK
ncbi:hypothetical protein Q5P01_015525 [Channa striata]|uniref:Uncharacterized protein n=1 Tax=Channa striata TaxID=64152 RepID=A0AA88MEF3_CHASR|nr:hypothetical protein Q5P01_015525 [Channa striata]